MPASAEQRAAAREAEALVLRERLAGKSLSVIEKEQGWSNAWRIWDRALKRPENQLLARQAQIQLEAARLDGLNEAIWPRAMAGEPRAVEVALKLLERRARMLGLDFADMVNSRLADIEQEKVSLMAAALLAALEAARLTPSQKQDVSSAFFAELRAVESRAAS